MPLAFLAPAFFLGLAAVAVPVVIHLVQRERRRVVLFPSLMFLDRLPYRSVRRRRVRHPVLLLLRVLALALLAAAFARPLLRGRAAGAPLAQGAREVVLLVDRSYSMGYAGRWAAARAAAQRVLAGLGPGDHVSLVVFDAGATLAVPPTTDAAPVRAVLDTLRPGWQRTRYAPAFRLAGDILRASRLERREAVLVSDFQRNGRDAAEALRLPPGARLIPAPVGSAAAPDVAVTGVSLRREAIASGGPTTGAAERVTATARVANAGAAPLPDLPVTLEVDGRALEARRVNVPASGAATVTFAPFIVAHPDTRGSVRIAPDALTADDVFRFVLSPGQALSVLLLEPGGGARDLFLRRALAFSDPPGFQLTTEEDRPFGGTALDRTAVVVLLDAPFPGGEAGRRLREWVAGGGGLIVAPGEAGGADGIPGIAPSWIGPSADAGAGGLALGHLEYAHPVFEPFAAPGAGSFADARFYRRRALLPGDSAAVLARFEDGAAALVERRYGRGRVLLWASTFDTRWGDFPLKPVFLPLVQQLVRYTSGRTPPRVSATVGQVLAPATSRGLVAIAPSGSRIRLPVNGGSNDPATLALDEAGFYELRDGAGHPAGAVAVNPDLAEADLTRLDPRELAAAVSGPTSGPGAVASVGQADLTLAEREAQQRAWWFLLAAAFTLFAAETVLSNRLSRGGKVEA